jgi:hypothetical protein
VQAPQQAATAAAAAGGLQLHLPQPVLAAAPAADGRHLALLLGSFAPAGEPTHVLVLALPDGTAGSARPGAQHADVGAIGAPRGSGAAGDGGSSSVSLGIRVVASLAVQRSRCADELPLGGNSLQLAATERCVWGLAPVASAPTLLQPPTRSYCMHVAMMLPA